MEKPSEKLKGIICIYIVHYKYRDTLITRPVCRSTYLERGINTLVDEKEESDRLLGHVIRVEENYIETNKSFFYLSDVKPFFCAFVTKENGVTLENIATDTMDREFDIKSEEYINMFENNVKIREITSPKHHASTNRIIGKVKWKPIKFTKLIIPVYEYCGLSELNKRDISEIIQLVLPGINLKNFNIEEIRNNNKSINDLIMGIGCLLNIGIIVSASSRETFKLNDEILLLGDKNLESLNKAGQRALDLLQLNKRL